MMKSPARTTTFSILSLSMVTGVTTLITGILPQLRQLFPAITTTWIEWLITSANLSALITLISNPRLTNRFGIRRVTILGLIISALAGAIPIWLTNFPAMLVSRIVLGLGIGLFSPHAIGLIAHSFTGDLRARLLGYQTGMSALGNAVLLALAGLIVALNWRSVFALYLLLLGVAWLIWRYVPEPKITATATEQSAKIKLPLRRWGLIGLTFITYLLIWGVQLKLPSLFAQRHFGDASLLNWTLSLMNLGGLLAGLSFGWLYHYCHRYTLTIGYAGAALAVLILLTTSNQQLAVAAAIGFNFIYSYTGPYLIFTSNTGLANAQINLVSSLLTIATIISAFFAPLTWNWLGRLGTSTMTINALSWMTGVFTVIAITSGIAFFKTKTIDER